ncbi:MAG: Holliday junction resolvase RuvX [Prevotellaceae bacterium]|jgi:putative Holliday junction resolvase|nr:Holliday junction resolvase RuvX [Prevotellaceae bacterium]
MDRIIGIDYGPKRVGLAVSDPLGIFASALDTVSAAKIIGYLQSYISGQSVSRFVVGFPKNLDNTPSDNAQRVMGFVNQLHKAFPLIPVSLEDERFTSKMAFRAMIDGGLKKMQRREKERVDKVSAAYILQTWMDIYLKPTQS